MRDEALDSFTIGSMQDFFYYRASEVDRYVNDAITLADAVMSDVMTDLASGNVDGLDEVMNRLIEILGGVVNLSAAPFQSGNHTERANAYWRIECVG
jgi:hypothetical protein